MNQILVTEKIYVTPKVKRKKRFYKIQFVVSILVVIILSGYYVYSEYDKRKSAQMAKDILNNVSFSNTDNTTMEDTLVVALDDNVEQVPPQQLGKNNNIYVSPEGIEYKVDAILNIPSLKINYPVLPETSTELLKVSLNKFWGGEPNSVGNYCIAGHNYDRDGILFGSLNKIQNGDIVELEDKTGKTLQYKVYNKFVVEPTDLQCTSQLTNGKTEMTLITCYNLGKQRLIVKCRAIE